MTVEQVKANLTVLSGGVACCAGGWDPEVGRGQSVACV